MSVFPYSGENYGLPWVVFNRQSIFLLKIKYSMTHEN